MDSCSITSFALFSVDRSGQMGQKYRIKYYFHQNKHKIYCLLNGTRSSHVTVQLVAKTLNGVERLVMIFL